MRNNEEQRVRIMGDLVFSVAFAGHRFLPPDRGLEERLYAEVCRLLREREFVEFFMGCDGNFDEMAAQAVRRARRNIRSDNSALCLVLPYPRANMDLLAQSFTEVLIAEGERRVHPKAAIGRRNRWMIDRADLLIACVSRPAGGAAAMVRRARARGIPVRNLALPAAEE